MIKKSKLWDISSKLIAFDTVSFKSNSNAASLIANELNDLGFKTFIERFDDCGCIKEQVIAWIGPEVEGGLILSGHIDTVPFENQPGWTKDALKLTLEDDKIFGRGTCDMKVFIAHCLDAFTEINLTKLKKPLVCIFTADEEIGCLGAHRLSTKLDKILDTMPIPSRAIIGEPTGFQIINTHKGIVQFNILVKGIAGHSSRPHMGKNAIETSRRIIQLTEELNEEYRSVIPDEIQKLYPDFPYNHLHLATISGGEATNMIPNLCEMKFSYRVFPGEDERKVFNDFIQKVDAGQPSEDIEFNFIHSTPAMPVATNSELEKSLKTITGKELISVSFATDGGELSKVGIESYVCGAGDITQAHMPDEYISTADFLAGTDFIKSIVHKLLF
jgi:acetylornithine deacetylase